MADMYDRSNMERKKNIRAAALGLGKLLADYKGIDVKVLDVSESNTWADYFIIATVSSAVHSHGLQKHVLENIKKYGLEVHTTKRKLPDGDDWILIDLGDVIVHLMSAAARSFYDLEKLWFGAPDLLSEN